MEGKFYLTSCNKNEKSEDYSKAVFGLLVLVLCILADLISSLEIQRLQLAGSSSTVFAVNLILNLLYNFMT